MTFVTFRGPCQVGGQWKTLHVTTDEPLLKELSSIQAYTNVLCLRKEKGGVEYYRFSPILLKSLFNDFSSENPAARDIFNEVKRRRETTIKGVVKPAAGREEKIRKAIETLPGFVDCFPVKEGENVVFHFYVQRYGVGVKS